MRVSAILTIIIAAASPAAPASAVCTFGAPSHPFCDPAAPAHAAQLPVQIDDVRITQFTIRHSQGRWLVDLTIETSNHPGRIVVGSYLWGFEDSRVLIGSPGQAVTTDVMGIDVGDGTRPYGLAVEWEDSNGQVWSRGAQLHLAGPDENGNYTINQPGNYSFWAWAGSQVQFH